jgi:hypothetical protein
MNFGYASLSSSTAKTALAGAVDRADALEFAQCRPFPRPAVDRDSFRAGIFNPLAAGFILLDRAAGDAEHPVFGGADAAGNEREETKEDEPFHGGGEARQIRSPQRKIRAGGGKRPVSGGEKMPLAAFSHESRRPGGEPVPQIRLRRS